MESIEVTSKLSPHDVAFALMKKSHQEGVDFILDVDECIQDLDFTTALVKELMLQVYRNTDLPTYDNFVETLKEISE